MGLKGHEFVHHIRVVRIPAGKERHNLRRFDATLEQNSNEFCSWFGDLEKVRGGREQGGNIGGEAGWRRHGEGAGIVQVFERIRDVDLTRWLETVH